MFDDSDEAIACKKSIINQSDNFCFLGISVCSFSISEKVLVLEIDIAVPYTLCLFPFDIGADIFGFALHHASVDGDIKFRCRIDDVEVLFLKVHIYTDFPEHPGDSDTVERISSEAADRFCDDHIYLAFFS